MHYRLELQVSVTLGFALRRKCHYQVFIDDGKV